METLRRREVSPISSNKAAIVVKMHLFHSHSKFAMNVRVPTMELDPHHFWRRKARQLVIDAGMVVGVLVIWALLTQLPWYQLWKQDAAKDCIYFGRAGAHCAEQFPNRDDNGSVSDPSRQYRRR